MPTQRRHLAASVWGSVSHDATTAKLACMSIYPWFTGQASFTTNPFLAAEAGAHGGVWCLVDCDYNGPFVLPRPAECCDHKDDVFLTCNATRAAVSSRQAHCTPNSDRGGKVPIPFRTEVSRVIFCLFRE